MKKNLKLPVPFLSKEEDNENMLINIRQQLNFANPKYNINVDKKAIDKTKLIIRFSLKGTTMSQFIELPYNEISQLWIKKFTDELDFIYDSIYEGISND